MLFRSNNCFYNNTGGNYKNVKSTTDIYADPLFADQASHDYHIKSVAGRWTGTAWVNDNVNSPCIDNGSTSSDYSKEPEDNGDRINIGRYGNTIYASKSNSMGLPGKIYDNRLREASPENILSDSSYIDIGGVSRVGRYRDIMWCDLSEYNNAEEIGSSTLSLYWYYPGSSRPNDTIIEVYRPASSWNPGYVSWNKKDNGVSWSNPGGDWYDKNGVLQGSTPYATLTFKANTLADNRYYELNVTNLVKEYVSGKYPNTGFLIKARNENNNYIAFFSSDCGSANLLPKLNIAYR